MKAFQKFHLPVHLQSNSALQIQTASYSSGSSTGFCGFCNPNQRSSNLQNRFKLFDNGKTAKSDKHSENSRRNRINYFRCCNSSSVRIVTLHGHKSISEIYAYLAFLLIFFWAFERLFSILFGDLEITIYG